MNQEENVVVRPLTENSLPDVVRIHRIGLGYTLNSRLGIQQLEYLYRFMAQDDESYVGVAFLDGQVAGAISGSTNANTLMSRLVRNAPLKRKAGLGLKFV